MIQVVSQYEPIPTYNRQKDIANRREQKRLAEQMQYTWFLQRDHDRVRRAMGLPVQFQAVSQYGGGVSPLTLPFASNLQSWHVSNAGLLQSSQLITSGASPTCNWDADLAQSLPFQATVGAGLRGVATYAFSIDGGGSSFQTGLTAVNTVVPLFGRTYLWGAGTYILNDTMVGVVKSQTNQTPKTRTLLGVASDAAKPRIVPSAKNNFPGILCSSAALYDSSSTWAADVASGNGASYVWMIAAAFESAAPSAVQTLMSMSNNTLSTQVVFLGARNSTNLNRVSRTNDVASAQIRDAGALSTAYILYTMQVTAGNLVSLWTNKTLQINALSFSSGQCTFNNVSLFGQTKGSSTGTATALMRATALEWTTYSGNPTAGELSTLQDYYIAKYNL